MLHAYKSMTTFQLVIMDVDLNPIFSLVYNRFGVSDQEVDPFSFSLDTTPDYVTKWLITLG